VYSEVVVRYFGQAGIRKNERLGPHALRATAATSALENGDIARVQEWLGLAC
jgi:integrase